MTRSCSSPGKLCLWAILATVGCSRATTQAGLEVLVETDLKPSQYSSIWVQVSQETSTAGWYPLVNEPLTGTLPARFAIAAGTNPYQVARIVITAYQENTSSTGPGTAVVVRTEQVQVPRTYVGQLDIELSATKASCQGTWTPGTAASPSTCTIDLADGGSLPAYQSGTSGFDATFADTGTTRVMTRDASAQDAAGDAHDATTTSNDAAVCSWEDATTRCSETSPYCYEGACFGITSVVAGQYNSCTLTTTGGVQCWGNDGNGQIGNNESTNLDVPFFSIDSGMIAVSTRNAHVCALTTTGTVMCWGYNNDGQVGTNSTSSQKIPVAVTDLPAASMGIATGQVHTCALLTGGSISCWGENQYGQLGNNSTTNSLIPVTVSGLTTTPVQVFGGYNHTCALDSAGGVECWGSNNNGQLGNNLGTNSLVPVAVSGLPTVTAVAAGWYHTCALTTAGAVSCWGNNENGQLGNNSSKTSYTPVTVDLGSGVTASAIAAGNNHSCAVTSAGAVLCWGNNGTGQLGNSSITQSLVPVAVSGITSGAAPSIAAGSGHTCVAMKNGGVSCWGNNSSGQLGNNSTTESTIPVSAVEP